MTVQIPRGPSERYMQLLKGEITSKEYVAQLKREARKRWGRK